MKLTRKLPDKPGWWWCWVEDMSKPTMHYFSNPSESNRIFLYTHFAGPIPQPDSPEPERVEVEGCIIKKTFPGIFPSRVLGTYTVTHEAADEPPDSFFGVPLKITLEKVEE